MTSIQENNSRIAKNTLLLYFRMILLMVISLFTSRVVLQALGIDDYGIYNVVGGFIVLFSFINGAISSSTSRYITFALGQGDLNRQKEIFATCLVTHIIIALTILVLGETIGLWFVMTKLSIPPERAIAAFWVYQCSIISSVIMIWSVPYNSCIIAHERMSAFAYISLFEATAKLIIVIGLNLLTTDRLIVYAFLLLIVQIIIRLIYTWYCHQYFPESKTKLIIKKDLIKETLNFAGWNLWGNLAYALFTQGINIILNIFFGPIVNAARGIAVTVQSTVQQFASNFQTALNPQITKSYANNRLAEMHLLICRSSKFTFLLLFCIIVPFFIETEFILKIWLGDVPSYSTQFTKLMLVICIIDAISNPFMTAASATGKVKKYQTILGLILLSIVPVAYVFLSLGFIPESVFWVQIATFIIAFIVRLVIVSPMIKLSITKYINIAIKPCLLVTLTTILVFIILNKTSIHIVLNNGIYRLLIYILITVSVSYFLGLDANERRFIKIKINKFLKLK